ncbi:hypothetical protein CIG75_16355 [Tumebacillus algifaecis]|uniref:Uncharacterized protein n=1 Tax=Tumebacillus algifaecis TaxID=1214604 RepID=A0A223D419_9BACL|nr:hypothetical protein [Tumebacillus algifaecis]ASS76368.1 hypothetical protein CIG75_16355 [Tumebacillus algifaecis]
MSELYYATYTLHEGEQMVARFADINKRDGFEISLGMYRANLGPVTRDVFMQYAERFEGDVVLEGENSK